MGDFIDVINNDHRIKTNLIKFFDLYQKSSDYYVYSICVKMSKYEKMLFDNF